MRQTSLKKFNRILRANRLRQLTTILALLGIWSSANGFGSSNENRQSVKTSPVKSRLNNPVRFEPNRGQFADDVKFVAQSGGENAFLTDDKTIFTVSTNFPTLNAYDAIFNTNGDDAFLTKFSATTTAAATTVSGRVLTTARRAVGNALVNLQGSNGLTRAIRTNWRGEFTFNNVPTGSFYIVSVTAKNYAITPNYQGFNLLSEQPKLEFVASPY